MRSGRSISGEKRGEIMSALGQDGDALGRRRVEEGLEHLAGDRSRGRAAVAAFSTAPPPRCAERRTGAKRMKSAVVLPCGFCAVPSSRDRDRIHPRLSPGPWGSDTTEAIASRTAARLRASRAMY